MRGNDSGLAELKPAVSIIMPCYNAAAHLQASIGSVQAQAFSDWELVIVDDGSGDASRGMLKQFASADPRIRVFEQSHKGAAAARNKALREARGTMTAFLDSDDTWHRDFLVAMGGSLRADPEAGLCYCGWQNIGLGAGHDEPYIPPDYETPDKIAALLTNCPWPIHAALFRTSLLTKHGLFDEAFSSCEDFGLWLRIGSDCKLVRVPQVLAFYHHRNSGQTTNDLARIALDHWHIQHKFLHTHRATIAQLGRRRRRQLIEGELLRRGYTSYWKRDLAAARKIFRAVMRQGYGSTKDWKYMLPALLPETWHRRLIQWSDGEPPS
jgi:glycosyltransferase involved in cell wall biosynthesis